MKILVSTIIFASFILSILASHLPGLPVVKCTNSTNCSCPKGYAMSKADVCEPIYTKGCPGKSFCLGNSSVCWCNKDTPYLKDDECNRECHKSCPGKTSCLVCRPRLCICPLGYAMFNDQCVPLCTDGCPNGYCFRPEICLCDNGYARSPNGTCLPLQTGTSSLARLGRVVLKRGDDNHSHERSSRYLHHVRGVLSYLGNILHQNGKLVILISCLIVLAIILLVSVYGILRNGTYYHLATEEYKSREPFYVYF